MMEEDHLGREYSYFKNSLIKRGEGSFNVFGSIEDVKKILYNLDFDINIIEGNIKVGAFREILSNIFKTSNKKKVLVIDRANLMTPEVYNTALKSIEEPRGNIFIFISKSELPSTIKSRSININLNSENNLMLKNLNLIDTIEDIEKNSSFYIDYLLEYAMKNRPEMIEELLLIKKRDRIGIKIDAAIITIMKILGLFNY